MKTVGWSNMAMNFINDVNIDNKMVTSRKHEGQPKSCKGTFPYAKLEQHVANFTKGNHPFLKTIWMCSKILTQLVLENGVRVGKKAEDTYPF